MPYNQILDLWASRRNPFYHWLFRPQLACSSKPPPAPSAGSSPPSAARPPWPRPPSPPRPPLPNHEAPPPPRRPHHHHPRQALLQELPVRTSCCPRCRSPLHSPLLPLGRLVLHLSPICEG